MAQLFTNMSHFKQVNDGRNATVDALIAAIGTDNGHRDALKWVALADACEEAGIRLGCFRSYIRETFRM